MSVRERLAGSVLTLLAARTPRPVESYALPPLDVPVRRTPPAVVEANGLRLEYDTFGEPDHPPVLLIMGLAAQMVAWDEGFCTRLAARGFRVIRFDNRDIGRSTWLDHEPVPDLRRLLRGEAVPVPYRLDDMAADTLALMDALGVQSAHLVGVSMGGMIAQAAAIRAPERVRTLTSIMSTTGEPDLPKPKRGALGALMIPAPRAREPYLRHSVRVWRVLNGPRIAVDRRRTRSLAELAYDRGIHRAGVGRQLAAILASPHRGDALRSLDVPSLVIHGDQDPLIPLEAGIRTAERIPAARLEVIPDLGHALPAPLWERIVDRVARHAAGAD